VPLADGLSACNRVRGETSARATKRCQRSPGLHLQLSLRSPAGPIHSEDLANTRGTGLRHRNAGVIRMREIYRRNRK
jgi:hypothetical protein